MNLFLQQQQTFWQKLLTPAHKDDKEKPSSGQNRFSFEELNRLYDVLDRNPTVNDGNKSLVVETIRNVSEFLIWGDQNEPRVFEFFLENNVLAYLHRLAHATCLRSHACPCSLQIAWIFLRILLQPANRSGDVAKQVLQVSMSGGLYICVAEQTS